VSTSKFRHDGLAQGTGTSSDCDRGSEVLAAHRRCQSGEQLLLRLEL